MKIINTIFAVLIAMIAVQTVGATRVEASKVECFKQYGGGETCIVKKEGKLELDKKVKNPKSGNFESDIKPTGGSNPYSFKSGENVVFRIIVKNVGDVELKDIELKDRLPNFVKYHSGDGKGASDNTQVEFSKFNLKPGESKEFQFMTRIAHDGILPKDSRICVTNIAEAKGIWANDKDKKEEAVDYANFCIELPKIKGVEDVKKEAPKVLPVTGADTMILVTTAAFGLMLIGYGLRKISD